MKPFLRGALLPFAMSLVAACAPSPPGAIGPPSPPVGLPPIPSIDGVLGISIVHPSPGLGRPNVDSVFIYGSVGSGRAELTINGAPVRVEPNGAFLGFLPRPANDTLRLEARVGGEVAVATTWYRAPPEALPGTPTPTPTVDFIPPRSAEVATGADTLATGSDVAVGRPTPSATYRWFLPRGARLAISGARGDMLRARLDGEAEAWFDRSALALTEEPADTAARTLPFPTLEPAAEWTDVRIAGAGGTPFQIEAGERDLGITLHRARIEPGMATAAPTDATVESLEILPAAGDAVLLRVRTRGAVWGYKAFYAVDGSLVLRVRRPPEIDPLRPLQGIRVVVDPGHPPGGAPGPTGLAEADANLGIGLRLAEHLRFAGAEILLTRSTTAPVALTDRVDLATAWDADLLVSVHNNAFPEGANPFRRNGTSTYYFHGFAAPFARVMNEEIVATTRIRDLGALAGNLALARPTWMPSILTESLFMPIPEQEAALRNTLFLEQLAAAHVRGIERFLRLAEAQPTPTPNDP